MKLAVTLAAAGAMLAMASPVMKWNWKTEVVVRYITVTVTDDVPTSTSTSTSSSSTTHSTTSTSSSAAPRPPHPHPHPHPVAAPAPTTTTAPPPPPPSPAPAPPPPPPPPPSPSPTPIEQPAPAATPVERPAPVAQPQAAAGPSEPDTSNVQTLSTFAQSCVDAHNVHRQKHSAVATTWDADLASYAQTVANTCVWGHNRTPGGGNYGQNIASYGSTNDLTSADKSATITQAITGMWYSEEPDFAALYGQENPDMSNFEKWGHFTQVVWKGTTKVGCAVAYCPNGQMTAGFNMWYSVCNYGSAGNVGGEYADNVSRPSN